MEFTPRILAVDDDENVRVAILECLSGTCVVNTIESADGLEEAVDVFEPDLVIMDVVMPGPDGISACRRLKNSKAGRGLPVLFLTGISADKHSMKGIAAGGDGWLAKPFTPDQLRARVKELLSES